MDLPTFFVSFLDVVAWPSVVLLIAYWFRKQLAVLLPLLRRLKAVPVEAEFENKVEQIVSRTDLSTVQLGVRGSTGQNAAKELLALASPRAAIMEAWLGVESALRRATMQKIATSPPPDVRSPIGNIKILAEHKYLTAEDVSLFNDLRGLRNQAAHVQDFYPTIGAAEDYVELAGSLEAKLEKLARLSQ